ncbi:hypothetical protein QBE52_05770 [Clostridiaceae bacterium 35-E11]
MKVEGFFDNIKHANNAVSQLKKQGFKVAFMDLVDDYKETRNLKTNLPGTENGSSLSDLVLGSGATVVKDRSKAPLAAADPSVSGIGRLNEIADINCKVVVEVDSDNMATAKQILKDMGGDLDNPNVDKPRIAGDADKVFDMAIDQLRKNIE